MESNGDATVSFLNNGEWVDIGMVNIGEITNVKELYPSLVCQKVCAILNIENKEIIFKEV